MRVLIGLAFGFIFALIFAYMCQSLITDMLSISEAFHYLARGTGSVETYKLKEFYSLPFFITKLGAVIGMFSGCVLGEVFYQKKYKNKS